MMLNFCVSTNSLEHLNISVGYESEKKKTQKILRSVLLIVIQADSICRQTKPLRLNAVMPML